MIPIKNETQIKGIRKSCKLAAECLIYAEQFVKPGETTGYINEQIANFIKKNNAIAATLNYRGYPAESCISVNEVVCHGIPSKEKVLKEGDVLNIDVTTVLDGYFGDTSKMYAVGQISQEAQDLLDHTKKSLYEGIKVVGPNVPFNMIGHSITEFTKQTKYSVVSNFVGHGCGVEFHENPKICHYVDEKFKNFGPKIMPGMTFTIEPMINLGVSDCVILEDHWTAVTTDNKLSAQYEHLILCTEDGYEILTELD